MTFDNNNKILSTSSRSVWQCCVVIRCEMQTVTPCHNRYCTIDSCNWRGLLYLYNINHEFKVDSNRLKKYGYSRYSYQEALKYILLLCGHWPNSEVDCRRVRVQVRRMRVGVRVGVHLRVREAEKDEFEKG